MAFKSKDGKRDFSMASRARNYDRGHESPSAEPEEKGDPLETPEGGDQEGTEDFGPPPIEQDPEAMQAVDILRQKGYTAQDVEMAMNPQQEQQEQVEPNALG